MKTVYLTIVVVLLVVLSGCPKQEKDSRSSLHATATQGEEEGQMKEDADVSYVWKDGFLEKDYSDGMSKLETAEFQMTKTWMSMQKTLLENGWMRLYGVGDREGIYGQGKGSNVRVRFINVGNEVVTIGVKWGDGNKKASRKWHERFQEVIAQNSTD